jgi:hypothetical protein
LTTFFAAVPCGIPGVTTDDAYAYDDAFDIRGFVDRGRQVLLRVPMPQPRLLARPSSRRMRSSSNAHPLPSAEEVFEARQLRCARRSDDLSREIDEALNRAAQTTMPRGLAPLLGITKDQSSRWQALASDQKAVHYWVRGMSPWKMEVRL